MSEERLTLYGVDNQLTDPISYRIRRKVHSEFTGSEVYFATSPQGDKVVIKLSANRTGAEREWLGLTRAYDQGVPVPEPIQFVINDLGKKGIVTRRIEGTSLSTVKQPGMRHILGQIVRYIHTNVPIQGEEYKRNNKADLTFYIDRSKLFFKALGDFQNNSNIEAMLAELSAMICDYHQILLPAFIHNDLHDQQVIVAKEDSLVITDFEMWREGQPLDDIAQYLFHSLRLNRPEEEFIEFIQGYKGNTDLTNMERTVISFYLLYRGLRGVNILAKVNCREHGIDQLSKIMQYLEKERLWRF